MPYKTLTNSALNRSRRKSYKSDKDRISTQLRNTYAWHKCSRNVLKRDRFCCDPLKLHRKELVACIEAHHIRGLGNYPEDLTDTDKIVGLCKLCHNVIEYVERRGHRTDEIVKQAHSQMHEKFMQEGRRGGVPTQSSMGDRNL